jgi:hypothetical protein
MYRNDASQLAYAKFIASLVVEKKLLHCTHKAVARVIEQSARMAEHQNRLSLHAADIANLLRESDYWARQAEAKQIQDVHSRPFLRFHSRWHYLGDDQRHLRWPGQRAFSAFYRRFRIWFVKPHHRQQLLW